MSLPGTFERVYSAIRDQLRTGAYRPGEKLEPATLSNQLNASVTPVRDALHRLTGERLVEAPRHEGFRAPMLTETSLRHLYAWHRDLLLLATARHSAERAAGIERPANEPGPSLDERRETLFQTLAETSGNPEHAHALRSVRARLGAIQQLEASFLDAMDSEISEICRAVRDNDRRAIRSSLLRYHRRRERIVPQLLARLQKQS